MRTKEAAEAVGVAADTLRRWDRLGLLTPNRDERGVRTYSIEDIFCGRQLLGLSIASRGHGLTKGRAA